MKQIIRLITSLLLLSLIGIACAAVAKLEEGKKFKGVELPEKFKQDFETEVGKLQYAELFRSKKDDITGSTGQIRIDQQGSFSRGDKKNKFKVYNLQAQTNGKGSKTVAHVEVYDTIDAKTTADQNEVLSLAKEAFQKKLRVVAFTRSKEVVENQIKEYYSKSNENNIDYESTLLAIQVDITNPKSVENGVQETLKTFGRIDVVVNNAGYSQWGNTEEVSDKDHREIFEVNYFSVLNIIKSTLPILRKQKSGLILNVSSLIGHIPYPGFSSYVATKYALTGLTLTLAKEVEPLGIKVVLLSPGMFKTDITFKKQFKGLENPIQDYYPNGSLEQTFGSFEKYLNIAKGSSDKFGDLVLEINQLHEQGEKLPSNLFIGSDATGHAQTHLTGLLDELNQWKDLSISTDY
ncbi:hypothetical protein ACTA71_007629 [Dictyostelium dimigraforme]